MQSECGISRRSGETHARAAYRLKLEDWLRQVCWQRAAFEYAHRLKYPLDVKPCLIEGKKSVIVARDLEVRDPFAFSYIVRFGQEHGIAVQVDRRVRQIAVAMERRHA